MHQVRLVVCLWAGCGLAAAEGNATIINGGFEFGDLTGWQAAASDDDNQPIAPPIAVMPHPQGNVAVLPTVSYVGSAGWLPLTSLFQTFEIPGGILVFDIAFATAADPAEPDDGLFRDSLAVFISDGSTTRALLAADAFGIWADPFSDAPGTVSRSASAHPWLSDHFAIELELAELSSNQVTLQFDLLNQADGHSSVVFIGGVGVVPEPGYGISMWILAAFSTFRRRGS